MADQEEKDQKTEEATPRRLEEARERGQVAISSELMAAVGLIGGVCALSLGGGPLMHTAGDILVDTLHDLPDLGTTTLTAASSAGLVVGAVRSVMGVLLMVTIPAVLLGALAGYAQVGFRVARDID